MPCPGGIPGAFTQLWLVRSMPGLEEDGMERRQMLPFYSCSRFRSQHPTRGGPRSRGDVKEVETPAACTDHRARLSAERADSQLRAARSLLSVTPLTPTLGRWEGWKWWVAPSQQWKHSLRVCGIATPLVRL